MKVVFEKRQGRWHWRCTGYGSVINFGSVKTFRFRFNCKNDFKKRYRELRRKRQNWPLFEEVEVSQ